jgi:transcriptional regulator with XRE-family HTH domain
VTPADRRARVERKQTQGRALKRFRKARGLDQTEFAAWLSEQVGVRVAQTTLSQWELGVAAIRAEVVEILNL